MAQVSQQDVSGTMKKNDVALARVQSILSLYILFLLPIAGPRYQE